MVTLIHFLLIKVVSMCKHLACPLKHNLYTFNLKSCLEYNLPIYINSSKFIHIDNLQIKLHRLKKLFIFITSYVIDI